MLVTINNAHSGAQVNPVDWPYEDTGDHKKNGGEQRTIADYLSDNMFDLVINLPLRNSGSYRASSFVTQGYKTRRMAVDYSVPLVTDIKCSKLLIESMRRLNGAAPPLKTHVDCISSHRVVRLPGMQKMWGKGLKYNLGLMLIFFTEFYAEMVVKSI